MMVHNAHKNSICCKCIIYKVFINKLSQLYIWSHVLWLPNNISQYYIPNTILYSKAWLTAYTLRM